LDGFGAFGGERADVVIVFIKPRNGSTAAVLSLPRDLLVDDICSDGSTRLNEALQGCEDTVNGPTALLLTVESLIGVTVDHFGLVDLAGFQDAVDAVGGYEICVDNAVRDAQSQLDLPAGCTHANGEQTLAWLRSRHTQELTETGWHTVEGVSDLTRNERQREFMIAMLGTLSDVTSPDDVTAIARTVAPYVTVDSGLGFLDAVGLAWSLRGLGTSTIRTLEVPVAYTTTEGGAEVLIATEDVAAIVDGYLHPVADPALSLGR
jgi:LCP family protein required for cell wall assembly